MGCPSTQQGMLRALHSTYEAWDLETTARDPYLHKQERLCHCWAVAIGGQEPEKAMGRVWRQTDLV